MRPRLLALAIACLGLLAAGGSSWPRTPIRPRLELTVLAPASLRLPGERARIRVSVYCLAPRCRPGATAYVRARGERAFRPLPLHGHGSGGVYSAPIPAVLASAPLGFDYYVVARDDRTGLRATLPPGGPAAPRWSLLLAHPSLVRLGADRFGRTRPPDRRVVSARFGAASDQVGLQRPYSGPEGVSSFAVAGRDRVWLLDEVKRRALRYGTGRGPTAIPLQISRLEAELAVAPNGSLYVLELSERPPFRRPVRGFDPRGRLTQVVPATIGEIAGSLQWGPGNAAWIESAPSGLWVPVLEDGRPLSLDDQARAGLPGRPLPDGRQLAVWVRRDVRVAVVDEHGVEQSWRILPARAPATLELAQPMGGELVFVFAAAGARSQYDVLVLRGSRVVDAFPLPRQQWVETAGSAFRLSGSSLYKLGSTPRGVFVDRYDLR